MKAAKAIVLVAICTSCLSGKISILVLRPPKVKIPSEIRKISVFPLVGCIVEREFPFPDLLIREKDFNELKPGYIDGFYTSIMNSAQFERVILTDTIYLKFYDKGQLYWDDLRKVCIHDSTDHIVLLQKANPIERRIDSFYSDEGGYSDGGIEITNQTRWVILDPFSETYTANIFNTDYYSLTCPNSNQGCVKEQLYDSFYSSGYRAANSLSPEWTETTRIIFKGPGKDLHDAARLIDKNNWRSAALLWNEIAAGDKRSRAIRAAHNMAVAWERDDVLDQAVAWIQYADSLGNNKKVSGYRYILETRQHRITSDKLQQ